MVTLAAAKAATDRDTSEVYITLIEISSAEIEAPLRFALNDADILHLGETYLASGFQYKPPAQGSEARSVGRLRIDNVDKSMSQTVIDLTASPELQIFEVLASSPDTIEKSFPPFSFFGIQWDLSWLEGSLGTPDDSDEACVSFAYSPKEAPALYAY